MSPQLGRTDLDILFWILLRKQSLKILNWTRIVWKLICAVLGVFSEFELGMFLNGAFGRLKGAGNEMQEGRLSGTIGAEDGDARIHAVGNSDERWS
jgi:hypothetical protein